MAIRNFKSGKLIFVGSIVTISLGTLCISLLLTYVHNELSTDKYHERSSDIYMTTLQASVHSRPSPFSPSYVLNFDYRDYPEVENSVALMKYQTGDVRVIHSESTFLPDALVVDSTFFEVFDFPLVIGDQNTVLYDPNSALITEQFARIVFGNKDPIGEQISFIANKIIVYTINGIIKDPPPNSSIIRWNR